MNKMGEKYSPGDYYVTYHVKNSAVRENLGESQPWIVIVKGYLYNKFKGQNLPGHGVLKNLSFNPFMTLFQISSTMKL